MGKALELTNTIIPSTGVQVVEFAYRKNNRKYWKCICPLCGQEFFTDTSHLTSARPTQSCGCLQKKKAGETLKKYHYNNAKDLTGLKFGMLTAIRPTEERNHSYVVWECKCDCGNMHKTSSLNLLSGDTQSCGCMRSRGEAKIKQLLIENNIIFEAQKYFNECKEETGYAFKFDFYINNQYCVEYDGDIHFGTTHGWNDEQHFIDIQYRDKLKNQYCFNHHIPLIRIPYTHLPNLKINDIILETSNFIVKE